LRATDEHPLPQPTPGAPVRAGASGGLGGAARLRAEQQDPRGAGQGEVAGGADPDPGQGAPHQVGDAVSNHPACDTPTISSQIWHMA